MTTISLPVRYNRYFPADHPHGSTDKIDYLPASSTAFLLVDVYHAAEKPEAKSLVNTRWDQKWGEIVNENLAPALHAAREVGFPVIYVMNSSPRIEMSKSAFGLRLQESLGFNPERDFRETDVDPREYCYGDPVQLVIPPVIAPRESDYYLRKHTYSGFFETRLASLLNTLSIQNLIVVGFVADCCILFTLADAVFRGYHTVLLRDCTLAVEWDEEIENFSNTQRTVKWIESIIGPSALSKDFIEALKKPV